MHTGNRDLLDSLRIASPCKADWSRMSGDERRRFCAECKLHVHDLSAMTRGDAVRLLAGAGKDGKRVCVRFHRRADGRVLTRDCPVGLRRRLRWAWARAAALFAALGSLGCARKPVPTPGGDPTGLPATGEPTTGKPLLPEPTTGEPVLMGESVMGDVLVPTPPVEQGRVRAPEPQGAPAPMMGTPAPLPRDR